MQGVLNVGLAEMHYPPGMASVIYKTSQHADLSIDITHPTPLLQPTDEVPTMVPSNDTKRRDVPTVLPQILTTDPGLTKSFYS